MPNYTLQGKSLTPISDEEFFNTLNIHSLQIGEKKTAFLAILFYLGIRVSEGLALRPEDFRTEGERLFVNIKRLKHSHKTEPLNIQTSRPYVNEIIRTVKKTNPKNRVWKFSRVTAWKLARDVFEKYPHYFRMSRITNLFLMGWNVGQIRSWTGLSVKSMDAYLGRVSVRKMGDSI